MSDWRDVVLNELRKIEREMDTIRRAVIDEDDDYKARELILLCIVGTRRALTKIRKEVRKDACNQD
ncbi:MAG: hypothetical protein ACTSPB_03500 [Candidatus Thorarchaeota archaeon]